MNDNKYLRSVSDLEKVGSKWWPKEIHEEALRMSILKLLLDTQEKFISILTLADPHNPSAIFSILNNCSMPYHLFLKHLALLTDVGAEPMQRFNSNFSELFPEGKMTYIIDGKRKQYTFSALPVKAKLDNKKMQMDTQENLEKNCKNQNLSKDVAMLLMFGAASSSPKVRAVMYRCNVFEYLGSEERIKKYVRENYIRVSKIISGRTASDLGNVAQSYAADYLRKKLGESYNVVSPGTIPDVKLDDNKEATFDIVVDRIGDNSKYKPYVGIEVSFQETSNSTVERKGREAQARFRNTNNKRCFVAYIIDGAGNFSRTSAANDMCDNSHCNVAYTQPELDLLAEFIKEKLG